MMSVQMYHRQRSSHLITSSLDCILGSWLGSKDFMNTFSYTPSLDKDTYICFEVVSQIYISSCKGKSNNLNETTEIKFKYKITHIWFISQDICYDLHEVTIINIRKFLSRNFELL